jgi:hypothetical protein
VKTLSRFFLLYGIRKSLIFQLYIIAKSKLAIRQHEQEWNFSYSCLDIRISNISYRVCLLVESIIQDQIDEAASIGIATVKLENDFKKYTSKHSQLLFATAEYVIQPWFRSLLKDKTALSCLYKIA